MENEENKISLEKNDNQVNNETNVSSYQNENYGQQEQQNVGNTNPYGILSLVCCCFWYVSGIFAVLGLAFSIIVLVKHKPGRGMAIAGLICSAIGLIIAVIMGIMVIYIGMNMSADDYKKIIDQINSME